MLEGFVRLRGQVNHEHKVHHTFKEHTRQLQTLSRAHKANNKQLQKSHEVLQVPTMPNNARCLGLVLFTLGSWLAIVVDVFIPLDSRFSRNLMVVGGEAAVWLNCRCRVGEVQIFRPSHLASHGCEVFIRVIEVLHMWQCLMTGLKISSQAIESLVLGDCKSASPGSNKVSSLTKLLVLNKSKIFVNILLPLQLERFEDALQKFAPSCAAKHQVYLGTSSNR
jgi:hypothetical protein